MKRIEIITIILILIFVLMGVAIMNHPISDSYQNPSPFQFRRYVDFISAFLETPELSTVNMSNAKRLLMVQNYTVYYAGEGTYNSSHKYELWASKKNENDWFEATIWSDENSSKGKLIIINWKPKYDDQNESLLMIDKVSIRKVADDIASAVALPLRTENLNYTIVYST